MLPAMVEDKQEIFALADLVEAVARRELCRRWRHVDAARKADGSLVTEADLAMQSRLGAALADRWPAARLLGEEMPASEQARLLADAGTPLWCLDPLDGTGNFAAGIPFFAVSLALIVDGAARAAVVHDPVRRETFTALRGGGAWLNRRPLAPAGGIRELRAATALIDFKRLPAPLAGPLAVRPPYRSQRSFGSVALDWCWIAAGRCQLYVHGGQKLWDYAAGVLVLRESGAAGGLLAEFGGDWVETLTLEPRIAVAASTPELLRTWQAWLWSASEND
jgi:myo-inositol-1(or 4)-monophosphatase